MMDEQLKKYIQYIGIFLLVFAQSCLTLVGISFPTNTPKKPRVLLTEDCEQYLVNNDKYAVPPVNCKEELKALYKRTKEVIKNADEYSTMDVSKD